MKKEDNKEKKVNIKKMINQDIFKVSIFFSLLFFALIFFLAKYQIFDASSAINNKYNRRSDVLKEKVLRGSIYTSEGNILAYTTTDENGDETRVYPYESNFFHAVGYEQNGGMGLESSYNYYLLSSHENIFKKIYSEFGGTKVKGDNIITTLDLELQNKINDILGENEGAVIAMDPYSGDILAMVSKPDYDPNYIEEAWDTIVSDSDNSILLNRATQATSTPGSTFKMFTLLEYYRENEGNISDFSYNCTGYITVDGQTFGCPSGTAHGTMDLKSSFAHSCNCAFSEIGLSLDINSFYNDNVDLLFNSDIDIDIEYNQSSFSLDASDSAFKVAQTAFGQGDTLTSPLHLALFTCAVANEGRLMTPHLVNAITDSEGNVVKEFENELYLELMSSDEASFMKDCMRAVVTDGTGIVLSYDGNYYAYGKTGTAETLSNKSENHDHSWFTGFAESNGRAIVVCAMIENTQEAGMTGISVAKQVFDHYFPY